MSLEERENEIRNRVRQRYDKRAEYFGNLIAFIVFTLAVWFIIMPTLSADNGFFRFLFTVINIGWAIGVAVSSVQHLMYELGERATQYEIEREREYFYMTRKAKNSPSETQRLMTLSDDGEIIDYEEDEQNRFKH